MKKENSYGIIPVYKTPQGNIKILLIHQKSGDFWGFPKGRQESGEQPEETARRELAEETGIKDVKIIPDHMYSIQYRVDIYDEPIDKTSSYFLGFVEDTTLSLQEEEILDASWLSFDEVRKLLVWDSLKQLFEKSLKDLRLYT